MKHSHPVRGPVHSAHQHPHARGDNRHSHAGSAAELRDPVCGMTVSQDSPHFAVHEGERHVFCSGGCRTKFLGNPQRYLSAASAGGQGPHAHDAPPTAPAAPAPTGTVYTCPMHPEIRQDHPGNCPKCGMALEPLMPQLEEDDRAVADRPDGGPGAALQSTDAAHG